MLSDYEKLREGNILQFRGLFMQHFGENPGDTSASSIANELSTLEEPQPTPRKRKRSHRQIGMPLTPPRRSARLQGNEPTTSAATYCESDEDEEEEPMTLKRKLNIKRSVTPRVVLRREIIPPEDIEEEDLKKICYTSAGKTYDSTNGSTCHQCRQKTADVKSICRNKECVGIRGQFCGFCLHNRYGENVAVILKDPNWSCPPCRNICNCSICRRRKGKLPTGILVPEAQNRGFTNVKDFLETVDDDDDDDYYIKQEVELDDDEYKAYEGVDENEVSIKQEDYPCIKIENEAQEGQNEPQVVENKANDIKDAAHEGQNEPQVVENKANDSKDAAHEGQNEAQVGENKAYEWGEDKSNKGEDKFVDELLDVGETLDDWMKVLF